MSEDKHGNIICELLEEELNDFSYLEDWSFELDEIYQEWEYYTVNIRGHSFTRLLRTDGGVIEVQFNEGSWQEIAGYSWKIKHFWMAILSWEHLR